MIGCTPWHLQLTNDATKKISSYLVLKFEYDY